MKPKLVSLTGPSCGGKTSLLGDLCKTDLFCKVVSFTSREPREGEVEGIDYHFKTATECQDLIVSGRVQEYSMYGGHYYGREKQAIARAMDSGKIPVLILDVDGLKLIRQQYASEAFSVYVSVPLEELMDRFLRRFKEQCLYHEDITDIKYYVKRLQSLLFEHANWETAYKYNKVINNFTYSYRRDIIQSLISEIIGK